MKINVKIGRDTLGDFNTEEDNERYCAAVADALEAEYPDSRVSVELAEHGRVSTDSDDDDQDIVNNINEIANDVWGRADY